MPPQFTQEQVKRIKGELETLVNNVNAQRQLIANQLTAANPNIFEEQPLLRSLFGPSARDVPISDTTARELLEYAYNNAIAEFERDGVELTRNQEFFIAEKIGNGFLSGRENILDEIPGLRRDDLANANFAVSDTEQDTRDFPRTPTPTTRFRSIAEWLGIFGVVEPRVSEALQKGRVTEQGLTPLEANQASQIGLNIANNSEALLLLAKSVSPGEFQDFGVAMNSLLRNDEARQQVTSIVIPPDLQGQARQQQELAQDTAGLIENPQKALSDLVKQSEFGGAEGEEKKAIEEAVRTVASDITALRKTNLSPEELATQAIALQDRLVSSLPTVSRIGQFAGRLEELGDVDSARKLVSTALDNIGISPESIGDVGVDLLARNLQQSIGGLAASGQPVALPSTEQILANTGDVIPALQRQESNRQLLESDAAISGRVSQETRIPSDLEASDPRAQALTNLTNVFRRALQTNINLDPNTFFQRILSPTGVSPGTSQRVPTGGGVISPREASLLSGQTGQVDPLSFLRVFSPEADAVRDELAQSAIDAGIEPQPDDRRFLSAENPFRLGALSPTDTALAFSQRRATGTPNRQGGVNRPVSAFGGLFLSPEERQEFIRRSSFINAQGGREASLSPEVRASAPGRQVANDLIAEILGRRRRPRREPAPPLRAITTLFTRRRT